MPLSLAWIVVVANLAAIDTDTTRQIQIQLVAVVAAAAGNLCGEF